MRENITLIILKDHPPSEEARKNIDFWFRHEPLVTVNTVTVSSSLDMKYAKKKYKFIDLPCVIRKDGRNVCRYYGEGIENVVKDLRGKKK